MMPRYLSLATACLLVMSASGVHAETVWPDKAAHAGPLGPPQISFPTSSAGSYNAFPAEILARMRTGLLEYTELPAQEKPPLLKLDDD